jgi:hypothetical protein
LENNFKFETVNFLIHAVLSRQACAMLAFCDRRVTAARKDIAPVWTRGFPIAKVPTTLGTVSQEETVPTHYKRRGTLPAAASGHSLSSLNFFTT